MVVVVMMCLIETRGGPMKDRFGYYTIAKIQRVVSEEYKTMYVTTTTTL
jgi:hypothetical protein